MMQSLLLCLEAFMQCAFSFMVVSDCVASNEKSCLGDIIVPGLDWIGGR
jgi:hypothetical protein